MRRKSIYSANPQKGVQKAECYRQRGQTENRALRSGSFASYYECTAKQYFQATWKDISINVSKNNQRNFKNEVEEEKDNEKSG